MSDESERASGGEQGETVAPVRAHFDWSSTTPAEAVVQTVAVAADRDPAALEPLYDAVDPDALNALVRGDGKLTDSVTVTFVYADRQVTVHGTGEVVVRTLAPER